MSRGDDRGTVRAALRGTGSRRLRCLAGLAAWAVFAACCGSVPAPCAADSLSVRWQIGAASDVTNEQYYLDAYVDTTFLGRRLTGTPEFRSAAVASLELGGRNARSWAYVLRPDLSVGDKVVRGAVAGSIRNERREGWGWRVDPAVEVLRDRSFGYDRRELRSSLVGRMRRKLGMDRENMLEFRAGGDVFRAARESGSFALSHDGIRLGAAFERTPFMGWEYRAEHTTHLRTFPDSAARNHVEHQWVLGVRRDFAGVHSLVAESDVQWRRTLTPQASTRDRFLELQPRVELTLRAGLSNSARLSIENDLIRYVKPDSTVDFDYDVTRARLSLRREAWKVWAFSAGPRYEILRSSWNSTERYREWAAVLEAERFSVASWWILAPAVSWRSYDESSAGTGFDTQAIHSSYVGYELLAVVDQALPGQWRVRATGTGRLENHSESSQDSRSLYFSFDVRRLF